MNQDDIDKKFDDYRSNGLIEFITFHPSYSYEDFVEGYKPEINDKGEMVYSVKPGIFKEMCRRALESAFDPVSDSKNNIYDIFAKYKNKYIEAKFDLTSKKVIFNGVSRSPSYAALDAINTISPEIENQPNGWIFWKIKQGENEFTLKEYFENQINTKKDVFVRYSKLNLKEKQDLWSKGDVIPRYVLIIDEINRGDISKIFGELITLIEDDKRLGAKNELIVKLPYSSHESTDEFQNDVFGVPKNLYIVATMNTADRSLALIDIALRRRFEFSEMKPRFNDLRNKPDDYGCVNMNAATKTLFDESITALENINIELGKNPDIGKDKKIGHAYLCGVETEQDILNKWKTKILPLLEEYYFFDLDQLQIISDKRYTRSDGWQINDNEDVRGIIKQFVKKIDLKEGDT